MVVHDVVSEDVAAPVAVPEPPVSDAANTLHQLGKLKNRHRSS